MRASHHAPKRARRAAPRGVTADAGPQNLSVFSFYKKMLWVAHVKIHCAHAEHTHSDHPLTVYVYCVALYSDGPLTTEHHSPHVCQSHDHLRLKTPPARAATVCPTLRPPAPLGCESTLPPRSLPHPRILRTGFCAPQLISSIGIPCQWVLGETITTRALPGGRIIAPPGERGARGAPCGRDP